MPDEKTLKAVQTVLDTVDSYNYQEPDALAFIEELEKSGYSVYKWPLFVYAVAADTTDGTVEDLYRSAEAAEADVERYKQNGTYAEYAAWEVIDD